jgi:hypothetical protein
MRIRFRTRSSRVLSYRNYGCDIRTGPVLSAGDTSSPYWRPTYFPSHFCSHCTASSTATRWNCDPRHADFRHCRITMDCGCRCPSHRWHVSVHSLHWITCVVYVSRIQSCFCTHRLWSHRSGQQPSLYRWAIYQREQWQHRGQQCGRFQYGHTSLGDWRRLRHFQLLRGGKHDYRASGTSPYFRIPPRLSPCRSQQSQLGSNGHLLQPCPFRGHLDRSE